MHELNLSKAEEIETTLSSGRSIKWMGQTILFRTHLFGKDYYWMRDGDGTHYLSHIGDDGLPDLA